MEEAQLFGKRQSIAVRSLFLGERIDLRVFETARRLAVAPLTVAAGESGCAVLFRFGVVVLFGLEPLEEVALLAQLETMISEPLAETSTEETRLLLIDQNCVEEIDSQGSIVLHEFSLERLQIVAHILAKSVVVDQYEKRVAAAFDRIEPLAASLQQKGEGLSKGKELMRHIGDTLLIQHKMVGRVEVIEKPEMLWERPKLERLYAYLEDEYEIQERHRAIERKLELISRTVETQLNLLHNNRALRLEWYVVILIVIEILLTLYQMFLRPDLPH